MPSVPISVQNANKPGGPVILGADGKIPSSAMPAGSGSSDSSGGGGSMLNVITIPENAIAESESTYETGITIGDFIQMLDNGPIFIHWTQTYNDSGFELINNYLYVINGYNLTFQDGLASEFNVTINDLAGGGGSMMFLVNQSGKTYEELLAEEISLGWYTD